MHLISLADPTTWPRNLVDVLERHEPLFQAWFTGHSVQSGAAFDAAHADVRGALDTCEVIGWHCTRLTDAEIALIEADGMQLPNVQKLNERINRLVETGQIVAVNNKMMSSIACTMSKTTAAEEAVQVIRDIRSITANTKERSSAYMAYNEALNGFVTKVPSNAEACSAQ